jgi:hypothetical protein
MRILGIDPGETTGYVLLQVDDVSREVAIERAATWHGLVEFDAMVNDGLFDGIDAMAIEGYIIYPNRAQSHVGSHLYTAQEIGRLLWVAYTKHIEIVKQQPASMAKSRWPDDRLEKYGLLLRGESLHARDALRHALTCFEKLHE